MTRPDVMTMGSADAALTNTNVARARATSRTDRVTRTLATTSLPCSRTAKTADALTEVGPSVQEDRPRSGATAAVRQRCAVLHRGNAVAHGDLSRLASLASAEISSSAQRVWAAKRRTMRPAGRALRRG